MRPLTSRSSCPVLSFAAPIALLLLLSALAALPCLCLSVPFSRCPPPATALTPSSAPVAAPRSHGGRAGCGAKRLVKRELSRAFSAVAPGRGVHRVVHPLVQG